MNKSNFVEMALKNALTDEEKSILITYIKESESSESKTPENIGYNALKKIIKKQEE